MNPISTLTKETQNAIKLIAEEVKPLLENIHSKPASTQNYYGEYMEILHFAAKDKNEGRVKLLAIALMYAGANPLGVEHAVKNVI